MNKNILDESFYSDDAAKILVDLIESNHTKFLLPLFNLLLGLFNILENI